MPDQLGLDVVNKKDIDLFIVETDITTMSFPGRKSGLNRRMTGQGIADGAIQEGDIEALDEETNFDPDADFLLSRKAGATENKKVKFSELTGRSPLAIENNDTISIPPGAYVVAIVVTNNSSGSDVTLEIGTTAGADDLFAAEEILDGTVDYAITLNQYFSVGATLHFTLSSDYIEIVLIRI